MHDNDVTIFRYLEPTCNDMISYIKDKDLKEILLYLDRYYLEYRDSIGIVSDITFGIELEMEHFRGSVYDMWPFQLKLNSIIGNNKWEVRNDITLNWGREIVSDILSDNGKTWVDIKNICDLASKYGEIDLNCSAHIHVGSQILGDNPLYWYRFFRMWSIYENVIYRFGYGEYLTHRPKINNHAKPTAKFFEDNLFKVEDKLNVCLHKMLYGICSDVKMIDYLKNYGLSYWHMLCDDDYALYEDYNKVNQYCTIEYRSPNGTLDEVIWQNYINFFIKLILYCKSDKFDEEILNRRKVIVEGIFSNIDEYNKVYLEQAIELSDMIFDNNLDKIYFLRQYLKSFGISDKPLVKARKFTVTSR